MTQEELNVLFNITIMIHEHEHFGKRKKPLDRNEVQKWVAMQLADALNIYTIPIGSSWGVEVDEERFCEYWEKDNE